MMNRLNIWYLSSLSISIVVAIPIVIIFSSFFELTSEYSLILKETFLLDYIVNSLVLLI
jgi:iron(III) transport system permease protein